MEKVHPYLWARAQRRGIDFLPWNVVQPGRHLREAYCLISLGEIERCWSYLGDEKVLSVQNST